MTHCNALGRNDRLTFTCFQSYCFCGWTHRVNLDLVWQNPLFSSPFLGQKLYLLTMPTFPQLLRKAASASRRLSRCGGSEKCVTLCFDANFLHFSSSAEQPPGVNNKRSKIDSRSYTVSPWREPVRIGCASGFWGDTATSGTVTSIGTVEDKLVASVSFNNVCFDM